VRVYLGCLSGRTKDGCSGDVGVASDGGDVWINAALEMVYALLHVEGRNCPSNSHRVPHVPTMYRYINLRRRDCYGKARSQPWSMSSHG